jgi:hypothetical protein
MPTPTFYSARAAPWKPQLNVNIGIDLEAFKSKDTCFSEPKKNEETMGAATWSLLQRRRDLIHSDARLIVAYGS